VRYALLWGSLWAQVFSFQGEVRSSAGEPLSHVIVRLPQTGYQTVTNAEGRFTVSVALDTLILELRHLGYKVRRDTLYRQEANNLYTFVLYPQEVRLGGVIITEGGKDPGELLIRKAIENKPQNRSCLPSFRTETYTLFSVKWLEPPNAVIRRFLDKSVADRQVLFMSETFSHIYFTAPDKYREEIIRSRIVGTQRYSFIGGWIFQGFDPYGERLTLAELTETPFILPLAKDAPLYYRYRLVGSYWEEDNFFYKIAVEPRSKASPCVEGYIVIADESYALAGLEWRVQSPRPLRYTDSIGVRATFVPVGACYVLGELSFKGHFRVSLPVGSVALVGEGYAAYRKYQALVTAEKPKASRASPSGRKPPPQRVPSPGRDSSLSRATAPVETLRVQRMDYGELVRILPEAAEATSAFWDSVRQAPLDSAQWAYIMRHDTLVAQQETTTSRPRRQFGLIEGGVGWSYTRSSKSRFARLIAGVEWVNHTPLEGWVVPLVGGYTWSGEASTFSLRARGRYGLGWGRFLPVAEVAGESRRYPRWRWRMAGGVDVREPSYFVQIPPFWNLLYRLAGQETPWQGYVRPFVEGSVGRYLHRTLEAEMRLSWDRRPTSPERITAYDAVRLAGWLVWRPGTRTFTTPRSTRFIPPEKPFIWYLRTAAEVAFFNGTALISAALSGHTELSISPLGRIESTMAALWQSASAPWADRLYVPTTALVFHRRYGDFVLWAPYQALGQWGAYGVWAWMPEGALLRWLPLLRRTSWQEIFVLRALYTAESSWHVEGSFFLHQINLRLKKTGVARPLSVGFHTGIVGARRAGAISVAIGGILSPMPLSKPAR